MEALLELLQIQVPSSAEPDKLVREAAQGHVDAVRDILGKCPDKVLLNIPLQFQDCQTDDLIGKLLITHLGRSIISRHVLTRILTQWQTVRTSKSSPYV